METEDTSENVSDKGLECRDWSTFYEFDPDNPENWSLLAEKLINHDVSVIYFLYDKYKHCFYEIHKMFKGFYYNIIKDLAGDDKRRKFEESQEIYNHNIGVTFVFGVKKAVDYLKNYPEKVNSLGHFKNLLRVCCRDAACTYLREMKKRFTWLHVSLDELKTEKEFIEKSIEKGMEPYVEYENFIQMKRIEELMVKLSSKSRCIFNYRYQETLCWDEIAKKMCSDKRNLEAIFNHNKNHLIRLVGEYGICG